MMADVQARRILVVDDDPGVRMLITRLLARAGYLVDEAHDAQDAWEMLQRQPYAAVILDLTPPGDGREVLYLRLLLADQFLAPRVIFIAGDAVNRQEHRGVATTGTLLIENPFDLRTLQELLESLLEED